MCCSNHWTTREIPIVYILFQIGFHYRADLISIVMQVDKVENGEWATAPCEAPGLPCRARWWSPLSPLPWKLLLMHYKASAEVQDNNGYTPLHLACTYGHEDVSGPCCPQGGCLTPSHWRRNVNFTFVACCILC